MRRYRRPKIAGGTFFSTVVLADRSSDLLVRHIGQFQRADARVSGAAQHARTDTHQFTAKYERVMRCRTGTFTHAGVCKGPASAVHRTHRSLRKSPDVPARALHRV